MTCPSLAARSPARDAARKLCRGRRLDPLRRSAELLVAIVCHTLPVRTRSALRPEPDGKLPPSVSVRPVKKPEPDAAAPLDRRETDKGRRETDGGSLPSGSRRNADR